MTYNVFGGTLKLARLESMSVCAYLCVLVLVQTVAASQGKNLAVITSTVSNDQASSVVDSE